MEVTGEETEFLGVKFVMVQARNPRPDASADREPRNVAQVERTLRRFGVKGAHGVDHEEDPEEFERSEKEIASCVTSFIPRCGARYRF